MSKKDKRNIEEIKQPDPTGPVLSAIAKWIDEDVDINGFKLIDGYSDVRRTCATNRALGYKTCICGFTSTYSRSTTVRGKCSLCNTTIEYMESELSEYIILSEKPTDIIELYKQKRFLSKS